MENHLKRENHKCFKGIVYLSIPTPKEVIITLSDLLARRDNKWWSSEIDSEHYYDKGEKIFGQLELGGKTNIPHYQLAIKTKSVCTRRKVLDALIEKINGLINVDVQFNFEDMKNYCSKETIFLSEEYSGKIYKYRWKIDFLDRKPQLK